ncbi:MAG: DnaJ C-terminal domain-containing protein [Planctomycetota bacterium]
MAEDYYKTLEVSRNASPEEIQKAYRRLARKYHPDLHEDEKEKEKAKQRFQQVQAAYDVLSEPEKREMYDRYGEGFQQMPQGNPFGGGAGPGGMEIDFSQIFGGGGGGAFEQIFRQFGGGPSGGAPGGGGRGGAPGGGGQRRRGPQPSQEPLDLDLEEEITIPFSVAVSGGEHQLSLSRGGKTETLSIKIPKGIEPGKKIRLRRQGQVGPGGQQGDLLVTVKVAPHPNFTRSGNQLQVKLPITIQEALLGTKVDLPTPHGTITVTVPAGSSSGRVLRLKGMGVHDDGKGDLLAEIEIVVPDQLAQEDRDALAGILDRVNQPNPRKNLTW